MFGVIWDAVLVVKLNLGTAIGTAVPVDLLLVDEEYLRFPTSFTEPM